MKKILLAGIIGLAAPVSLYAEAKRLVCIDDDNLAASKRLWGLADSYSKDSGNQAMLALAQKFQTNAEICEASEYAYKYEFVFDVADLEKEKGFAEYAASAVCGSDDPYIVDGTRKVPMTYTPSVISFKVPTSPNSAELFNVNQKTLEGSTTHINTKCTIEDVDTT